jgi:hypothetical protein
LKKITFVSCILTGLSIGLSILALMQVNVKNAVGIGIGAHCLLLAGAELFDVAWRSAIAKAKGYTSSQCSLFQVTLGGGVGIICIFTPFTLFHVFGVLAISLMYHDLLETICEDSSHARSL